MIIRGRYRSGREVVLEALVWLVLTFGCVCVALAIYKGKTDGEATRYLPTGVLRPGEFLISTV